MSYISKVINSGRSAVRIRYNGSHSGEKKSKNLDSVLKSRWRQKLHNFLLSIFWDFKKEKKKIFPNDNNWKQVGWESGLEKWKMLCRRNSCELFSRLCRHWMTLILIRYSASSGDRFSNSNLVSNLSGCFQIQHFIMLGKDFK